MNTFTVLYFDGKTSKSNVATLFLEPTQWQITFTDTENAAITVVWELNSIQKRAFSARIYAYEYGEFPKQYIETENTEFENTVHTLYPNFYKPNYFFSLVEKQKSIVAISLAIISFFVLSYLFLLPYLGERIADYTPITVEKKLGNALYDGFIQQYSIDEKQTKNANDFANAIHFNTNYTIKVTVVKNPIVNAFALPGGHVIIFDGIIKKMKTKEELAALLTHEVAHIHYKHSLKSIFRSLSSYLFISVLLNDVNGVVAVLAENSNMIRNLGYSRNLETEADEKGMEIMQRNKISIKGYVSLFEILEKENSDHELHNLLSTHPLTTDRIKQAKKNYKTENVSIKNHTLERVWQNVLKNAN